MAENQINITPMDPNVFGVQLTEGTMTTSHQIELSGDVLDLVAVDPSDQDLQLMVVRETFKFLLERETATEILSRFSLDDVSRLFPEYTDELRSRISNY